MNILIESTNNFEKDLKELTQSEQNIITNKINDYVNLFTAQKSFVDRNLHHLSLPSNLSEYESSLYTLRISSKLRLILAIDEDPIFEQIIFTLFRAVEDSHHCGDSRGLHGGWYGNGARLRLPHGYR